MSPLTLLLVILAILFLVGGFGVGFGHWGGPTYGYYGYGGIGLGTILVIVLLVLLLR